MQIDNSRDYSEEEIAKVKEVIELFDGVITKQTEEWLSMDHEDYWNIVKIILTRDSLE